MGWSDFDERINMNRINKVLLLTCFSAVFSNNAVADQAITEYSYERDKIYTINTGVGIVTQIELSPHENIKDFSTGYSNGWDLVRRDNIFYLRPKDANADTNMTIKTAAHDYIFDLKVLSKNWRGLESAKSKGVQYKIKFTYADGTKFDANKNINFNSGMNTKLSGHSSYFTDYDYSADDKSSWLVPYKVYDDGKFTYIHLKVNKFMPTGNFPAVFARKSRKGEEMIVNTVVENDILVVSGTYPFLVLRHGDNVVGIRRNFQ